MQHTAGCRRAHIAVHVLGLRVVEAAREGTVIGPG